MASGRGQALGVAVVVSGLGCVAAAYAGWRTYDRPETLFCRATSGVPNYFPCVDQPHAHVRVLPTVGVGVAAIVFALIVLFAYQRKHWIAPVLVAVATGIAIGEFAANRTYIYPNVQYGCMVGQACRPDPQPHVNFAATIAWSTFATVAAGAIGLAALHGTRRAGLQVHDGGVAESL